jgi:hypothetical protein
MKRIEEQGSTTVGTTVLPALIQIQEPLPVTRAPNARKRRICVILDHSIAWHLGVFSWILVAVAVAAARPITAAIVGVVVFIGLLIGLINGLRWLFGPK